MNRNFDVEELTNNKCFYFSLSIAFRSVNRVMEMTLKKAGLTPIQFLALKGLYDKNGMTIKELSELLAQDSTSITRLVDRLEKAELVVRKTGSNDKRSINVFLSDKARSYAPKAKKIWMRVNRLLKKNFDEQDLIGFFNVMDRMREMSYSNKRERGGTRKS
ncbi:MAG: MarR family transcriptional regulator [Spirochaetota bacterium]